MTAGTIKAAIYARLSLDTDGRGVAVDRQLQDCRDLAARRGWEVVAEYADNSKSAWKRDRKRPGWDALLTAIKHDEVQAIVVWHGDRLMRQPHDLEQLISLVEDKGLLIASLAGERDLGRADDRFITRIEVAAQCRESDSTARRVRRVKREHAQEGRRPAGTPFGWRTPEEGDVVRAIVADLLAGVSLRGIANRLNERGVASPRGGAWDGTKARTVAKRWANAGKRVHHGAVVADGQWDALVSVEDQERVLRLLADPARDPRASGKHGTRRRQLLIGVARCGVCGGPVRSVEASGVFRYKCRQGFCASVPAVWLDGMVLALAQARIDAAGVRPDTGDEESRARSALVALRARKEQAADDYADGAMDAAQLRKVNTRLDARIAEAEARLRTVERRSRVAAGTVLADLDDERQRAVLQALFERVEIHRAVKGAAREDRIVPVWSVDAGSDGGDPA